MSVYIYTLFPVVVKSHKVIQMFTQRNELVVGAKTTYGGETRYSLKNV